jgi:hypothetical protein
MCDANEDQAGGNAQLSSRGPASRRRSIAGAAARYGIGPLTSRPALRRSYSTHRRRPRRADWGYGDRPAVYAEQKL